MACGAAFQIQTGLLPVELPVTAPGKAATVGPSAGCPKGDPDAVLAPGLDLAQPQLLGPFGE